MHHINANLVYWEKAWQQLHKNPTSCIEQILEPTSHKTAASRKLSRWDKWDTLDSVKEVRTNSKAIYSYGPLHSDELELIYKSPVRILDVAWKTYWKWWTIEKNCKRGSGKSMLAMHDDDDDDTFPKDISPKVNAIEQLEFELAYFKAAVQHFIHYITRILPYIYIYIRQYSIQ